MPLKITHRTFRQSKTVELCALAIKYEILCKLCIDTCLKIVMSEHKYCMCCCKTLTKHGIPVWLCIRAPIWMNWWLELDEVVASLWSVLVVCSPYISSPCWHLYQGQFPDRKRERAQKEYEKEYNEHSTWVHTCAFLLMQQSHQIIYPQHQNPKQTIHPITYPHFAKQTFFY